MYVNGKLNYIEKGIRGIDIISSFVCFFVLNVYNLLMHNNFYHTVLRTYSTATVWIFVKAMHWIKQFVV